MSIIENSEHFVCIGKISTANQMVENTKRYIYYQSNTLSLSQRVLYSTLHTLKGEPYVQTCQFIQDMFFSLILLVIIELCKSDSINSYMPCPSQNDIFDQVDRSITTHESCDLRFVNLVQHYFKFLEKRRKQTKKNDGGDGERIYTYSIRGQKRCANSYQNQKDQKC